MRIAIFWWIEKTDITNIYLTPEFGLVYHTQTPEKNRIDDIIKLFVDIIVYMNRETLPK